MVEWLDAMISQVGPLAFAVLGISAALEYVVPPFPGDTVVLLGGVYAARGNQPWWLVLAVVTAGSLAGAAINYRIGRWLDVKFERRLERKALWGMSLEQLLDVERKMRRRGTVLLLLNRFIPGVRGLLFVAAGMSAMPLPRVLGLGAISAVAHALIVIGAGIALGGNAERLQALATQYELVVAGGLAVVVAAYVARWLYRRHVRRRDAKVSGGTPGA